MATFYSYGQNSGEAAVTYTTSFNASTGKSTLSMTAFTMKKGSGTTVASTTSNTYFYIIINGTQYSIGKHSYTVPKGGSGGSSESFSWSAEYTPGTTLQIAFDDPGNNIGAAVGSSAYASVTVAGYPTYTVSYAANGGTSTPASQTKTGGTNLTLRAGISHNNTTANGYTVTFNANGGSVDPTSKTATDTTTYSFASGKATDGTTYSASGTYTANAATTMTAQGNTSVTKGSIATPTATHANGTATRTVTFNANGGSTTKSSQNSTATITYTANGGYTAASEGTKRCDNGGTYTPTATETVVQQGGSSTGSYSAVTLPTTTECTRTDYTLLGFSTSDTATTATYAPGASYTPDATRTLYAVGELSQAKAGVKINNTGVQGLVGIKQNGTGVAAKKVYTKENGTGKS